MKPMNILVINGSPKGEHSITLQTVFYLEKLNPQHKFQILHAGQKIKALEKNFTPAIDAIKEADVLSFLIRSIPSLPLASSTVLSSF